jgi:hypothetical protein
MATSTVTVEFNEGRIINADETHPVLLLVYDSITGTWQPMAQPGGGGGGPSSTVSITDAGGVDIAAVIPLSVAPVSTDKGLLTQAVIHGLNSGGGGAYLDVKVNPSGALTVETNPANAALLADAVANPITGSYGAYLAGYNGATWDRLRSSIANGLVVDVSRVQGTVDVTGSGVVVAGTVAVSNFPAVQPINDNGGSITVDGPLTDAQLRAAAVPVSGTFFQATQPISAVALPLPAGAATEATLATRLAEATFTARINTLGQKAMAASTPVVLASDQSAIPTKEGRAGTNTRTSVAAAVVDTSILAANTNRLGATIYNDSTANLFLALGAAASTTDFTVKMVPDSYYEVPFNYTGAIRGIWASATGNARVGELT